MRECYEYLKAAGTFFLATCENTQPRVRPFSAVWLHGERLYLLIDKTEAVSLQLHANPRLELCAMGEGSWLRLEAIAVEDDSREIRAAALGELLQAAPDESRAELWYLRKATATFFSFTDPPRVKKF